LAWGNVIGTVVVLLTFNLGVAALVRPITADPLVLRLHAPYLIGCIVVVAGTLVSARSLGLPAMSPDRARRLLCRPSPLW